MFTLEIDGVAGRETSQQEGEAAIVANAAVS
jgi:hypothetical protein